MAANVDLGCGLIAIGRQWGTTPAVPSEEEALAFLNDAYGLGVTLFDTAPSYGLSEERLGTFLGSLDEADRDEIFVSTKCGEFWDREADMYKADHSEDALRRSIDNSLDLLGPIALLQVHKATGDVIRSKDVDRAITYAREQGIPNIGASVSDPAAANLVLDDGRFDHLQLPCNAASPQFREPIERSRQCGVVIMTNRPFQMGAITEGQPADKRQIAIDAFRYILGLDFDGVILTGTSNSDHLRENLAALYEVQANPA